ncbi:MFS transporter [filamentous cyanobacterium CCP2]|nr:MFS transporter [filamentous cyanobacterium CCP2]
MHPLGKRWLRWLNLRPEESERTFLMFAFYTLSSVGILWLEVSVAALFLGEYGARSLPWIYIASAGIGTGIGVVYSWMQRVLPLHRVLVLTAVLMAVPLLLFRIGMHPALMGGYTVFLMRLWMEAIYVINELNTSITANQLFTIREIKRTYPLISSGILAADVLSGFSLPFLRGLVGLPNVILLACTMLLLGAGILLYLTRAYRPFFPDASRRRVEKEEKDFATRRLRGSQQQYVVLVFAFFCMVQVLSLLLDFQYLGQLEQGLSVENIADFLALFSAVLGIFELATQWFVSGRAIERLGVFVIAALPPLLLAGLSALTLTGILSLFVGVIGLKFVDELLRYTLVASTAPILFQPIPDTNRNRIQSIVRGIAEPLSAGLTGAALLGTIWLFQRFTSPDTTFARIQGFIFLLYTAIFSLLWLLTVLKLRSKYLEVLVLSSDRGQLSLSYVDLTALRRNLVEALNRATSDDEKSSCIGLLTDVDPKRTSEVLSSLLPTLSPKLQRQSLEAMLNYPDPAYLDQVRSLLNHPLPADVLAKVLRYVWLTDAEPDHRQLKPYLLPEVDPEVRGTAAALLLRCGNPHQKAEATDLLRRMLTSKQERDRLMGCRALSDAVYLQSLRLYINPLLQDESLRVRCAMLDVIAATHLEEYYSSLLRGLHYKSTREAAQNALVRLGSEAIPLLVEFAEDPYKPEGIRAQAWLTIGQIASPDAVDLLVSRLLTAWGATRRTLLRVLLRVPKEAGVEAVLENLGRLGIESLIHQELQFLAHIYAGLLDLDIDVGTSDEADLLRRALQDAEGDTIERLFLLMRFLYDSNKIQAAAFSLQSESRDSVARGLEILDNTIDLSSKSTLLNILDRQPIAAKVQDLSNLVTYQPMSPHRRLRYLLDLRHFLSDWTLACCFHLSRRMRWSLTTEQILVCLRYPTGFVREAVLAYLRVASPKTLRAVLPRLRNDPDRLVALQVEQMMAELRS